jgi:two-component system, chemotaxis family, protein-glutamate methylesterase/glutaminase
MATRFFFREISLIKVLVVDDSAVVREALSHILSSDPEIIVIGSARDGEEAIKFIRENRPDVVTMDIEMPRMGGFEATRQIMENNPVPVVIITASWNADDVQKTWKAVDSGALAILEKPRFDDRMMENDACKEIILTVKAMSQVKVIRRWPPRPTEGVIDSLSQTVQAQIRPDFRIVAVGASTGGPPVIKEILSQLKSDFPSPIVVVQHIARNFTKGFVDWLASSCSISVRLAENGDRLEPGNTYVAPDGKHMKVVGGTVVLTEDPIEHGLRPSVSYLFRSVVQTYGASSIGVLLTGMGEDGAEELKQMKEKGAITIAQDRDSSVVHGMPGQAIKLGAAQHILPPDEIAKLLIKLALRGRT